MQPQKPLKAAPLKPALSSRAEEDKNVIKKVGTILIVEDEESLAEILDFNLRRQGFNTSIATNGLEACRIIGRERPDLILLDIMIPLLNGWEICHMVRSHHDQKIKTTPIIMLSALGTKEDKQKGYDLGANLYLPKPYNVKDIALYSHQLINNRDLSKNGSG